MHVDRPGVDTRGIETPHARKDLITRDDASPVTCKVSEELGLPLRKVVSPPIGEPQLPPSQVGESCTTRPVTTP